jgi:hypothetical protein
MGEPRRPGCAHTRESEGRPEGRDADHWQRAREQLGASSSPVPAPVAIVFIPVPSEGLGATPDASKHPEAD